MKVDPKSRNGSKYTTDKSRVVIKLLMQGESIKYSAQQVGVSPSTLYRWSKKYKKFGKIFTQIQRIREENRAVFCRIIRKKAHEEARGFE